MKPRTFASYLVAYLLIISLACLAQNENEQPSIRQPAVAGSFYPADPVQLKNQLADFFQDNESVQHDENIIALIAPHAGYVFSGEVAASAYAQLNRDKSYEHIFVLGPSHHVRMDGASIYNQGNYLTPLGPVKVDTALANQLISEYPFFQFVPSAHKQEHSIEVQLPFLQYWLHKPITIVPILPGTQSVITCNKIADALKPYFNSRNLFVISSDFSHYPTYKGAEKADQTTGDAIATNSPNNFLKAIRKNESQG
ncbi:MAG TPA: AmmeMemoRadiSam system protein B, partial [Sunxiuqinia sp.]|nr:AmmeMemoRadiSam system protein B [Sunxiuqinia sp.]